MYSYDPIINLPLKHVIPQTDRLPAPPETNTDYHASHQSKYSISILIILYICTVFAKSCPDTRTEATEALHYYCFVCVQNNYLQAVQLICLVLGNIQFFLFFSAETFQSNAFI